MTEHYALDSEASIANLQSDAQSGLTADEAARRLAEYGPNELQEAPRKPAWIRFLGQFTDLIVIVLLAAAVVSAIVHEASDAIAIAVIVVINGILGFVQEERAEKALAALKRLAAPKARVVRDGQHLEIESRDVVPGDLVEIDTGDFIPADVRIIEAANLQIEEAALTGESVPVTKDPVLVFDDKTPLGDRRNMAHMGTAAAYGRGRALVVATGMQTEVGRIAGLLQKVGTKRTPLQKRLEGVGKLLIWVTLGICAFIFALGIAQGQKLLDQFMIAVSLAVAAIPEGLPAVVTIALAIGVQRMVRRHVLIRKLPSVETLGCVSVICTDKTGTLTQNAMTVRQLFVDGAVCEVTGGGYGYEGEILSAAADGNPVEQSATMRRFFEIGALCNNAKIGAAPDTGTNTALGDPTEAALLVAAYKGGADYRALSKELPRVDEIPFDSERKAMSVIIRGEDGGRLLYTKGAPDVIARLCANIEIGGEARAFDDEWRKRIENKNEEFALSALRVLAVAYRRLDDGEDKPQERSLTLCGLYAMMDPPRPEVREAVEHCRTAGIRAVMITGDHKATAVAIARELGIWQDGDEAISGTEIDELGDAALDARLERTRIYARVSAEHKVRIVAAWRRRGEIVGVTGDGVNDAPAIKEADIGIAMGITGTDVTKEASDMIITDDNFASIVSGVEEGRAIYANIKKFIHFLLSCNIGEVFTVFLASIIWKATPLLPVQLLWINLVTDGLPALALGVEPPERDVMKRRPRPKSEKVIPRGEFGIMSLQGFIIAVAALVAYKIGQCHTEDCAHTMAFATLVVGQLLHAFDCRSTTRTVFSRWVFGNRTLVLAFLGSLALQVLVISLPFTQEFFKLEALSLASWGIVAALGFAPVIASEIIKIFLRRAQTDRIPQQASPKRRAH